MKIVLYTKDNGNAIWLGDASSKNEAIKLFEKEIYGDISPAQRFNLDEEGVLNWYENYVAKEVPENFNEDCSDEELYDSMESWGFVE
jgi:hypothetical protein